MSPVQIWPLPPLFPQAAQEVATRSRRFSYLPRIGGFAHVGNRGTDGSAGYTVFATGTPGTSGVRKQDASLAARRSCSAREPGGFPRGMIPGQGMVPNLGQHPNRLRPSRERRERWRVEFAQLPERNTGRCKSATALGGSGNRSGDDWSPLLKTNSAERVANIAAREPRTRRFTAPLRPSLPGRCGPRTLSRRPRALRGCAGRRRARRLAVA